MIEQTAIVEKIKQMIDRNYVEKFDVDTVAQLCFIPIAKQKDSFFAVVKQTSSQHDIEKKIQEITGFPAKFVLFQDEQYKALYEYYTQIAKILTPNTPITPQTTPKQQTMQINPPKKRLGDLLKEAGYVNEQQLMEALIYGKTNNIPIGSALVEKGYITVCYTRNIS